MGLEDLVDDTKDEKEDSVVDKQVLENFTLDLDDEEPDYDGPEHEKRELPTENYDWSDTADCPNCEMESPRRIDEFKNNSVWYFRCVNKHTNCPVTSFTKPGRGG